MDVDIIIWTCYVLEAEVNGEGFDAACFILCQDRIEMSVDSVMFCFMEDELEFITITTLS